MKTPNKKKTRVVKGGTAQTEAYLVIKKNYEPVFSDVIDRSGDCPCTSTSYPVIACFAKKVDAKGFAFLDEKVVKCTIRYEFHA